MTRAAAALALPRFEAVPARPAPPMVAARTRPAGFEPATRAAAALAPPMVAARTRPAGFEPATRAAAALALPRFEAVPARPAPPMVAARTRPAGFEPATRGLEVRRFIDGPLHRPSNELTCQS